MNIRRRIGKLEIVSGRHCPLQELSDAELEARICKLLGLPTDTKLTNEMLENLIRQTKAERTGTTQ